MCLQTLTKNFNPPREGVGAGWKLFDRDNAGKYISLYFNYMPYSPGTWYTSSNGTININSEEYEQGFHIYTNVEAARQQLRYSYSYIELRKVEYDDVVAIGTESLYVDDGGELKPVPITVAKQMRIVPDEAV